MRQLFRAQTSKIRAIRYVYTVDHTLFRARPAKKLAYFSPFFLHTLQKAFAVFIPVIVLSDGHSRIGRSHFDRTDILENTCKLGYFWSRMLSIDPWEGNVIEQDSRSSVTTLSLKLSRRLPDCMFVIVHTADYCRKTSSQLRCRGRSPHRVVEAVPSTVSSRPFPATLARPLERRVLFIVAFRCAPRLRQIYAIFETRWNRRRTPLRD